MTLSFTAPSTAPLPLTTMRYSSIFSSVSALALALATLAAAEEASDVINLSASDFDSLVNPEPLILVEFFAPW